jgi:hypothetical protein
MRRPHRAHARRYLLPPLRGYVWTFRLEVLSGDFVQMFPLDVIDNRTYFKIYLD